MSEKKEVFNDNIDVEQAKAVIYPEDTEGLTGAEVQEALDTINEGYRIYDIKGHKIRVYYPSAEVKSEADYIHAKAYLNCLDEGLPTVSQLMDMLEEKGIWTKENEKALEKAQMKATEAAQKYVTLSKDFIKTNDPKERESLAKKIKKIEEEYNEAMQELQALVGEKERYLSTTADALAEQQRRIYYIYKLVRREDGSEIWKDIEDVGKAPDVILDLMWSSIIDFYRKYSDSFLEKLLVPPTGEENGE